MSSTPTSVDISVVIVGWNARHYLELCLESLAAAPPRRSMEIFVVDNASTDGSAEMIEARFPGVKLIKSPENLGFARGNNVAIRLCQGRYIALVNPDVIVFPGCLDALADFLDQNPKVGNVGPRVLNPDMTLQNTCRRFPTLWNNFCSATNLAKKFKNSSFFAGEQMLYFPHDRTLAVDVLVGCFSMIRRETFDAVGLLDEGLFMYGDDVDWCRRCWNAGWQVVFYPGGQAIHYGGKITAPYPVRFAVAQQKSVLYYWTKHHSFLGVLGIRSIMLFHHLMRYTFAALLGLAHSQRRAQNAIRRQVSGACLRELFSGRVPYKARGGSLVTVNMTISTLISRFTSYYTRHGFKATIRRGVLAVKRGLFSNRMVVSYCDLYKQTTPPANIPSSLKVARLRSYAELSPQYLQEMTNFWNPKQAHRNIRERFERGSSLWLIKSEEKLAGYGWTLQGGTIEPHYFLLAKDDVHFFDFHVFPQYRGRGLNPLLVTHILHNLETNCEGRAFIEVADWNEAQLSSLRKTPFRRLGLIKSFAFFGHTFVPWVEHEPVEQIQKDTEQRDKAPIMEGSHKK